MYPAWTPERNPFGIPRLWSGFFPCVSFHGSRLHPSETTGRREQRVKGLGLVVYVCCSVLLLWSGGSAADLLRWFFPLPLWYTIRWGPLGPWGHNSTCEWLVVRSRGPTQKSLCWTFVPACLTPDHLSILKTVFIILFQDMFSTDW